MLRQVIAPHEPPLADGAGELLFAGMRAFVPRQFVAAREAAAAVLVRARERSLAGVGTHMSLQVRRLKIVLATARILALVNAAPCLRRARARRCGRGGGHSRWRRAGD